MCVLENNSSAFSHLFWWSQGFMPAFLASPSPHCGIREEVEKEEEEEDAWAASLSIIREEKHWPSRQPAWVGVTQRHKGMHHYSFKERMEGAGVVRVNGAKRRCFFFFLNEGECGGGTVQFFFFLQGRLKCSCLFFRKQLLPKQYKVYQCAICKLNNTPQYEMQLKHCHSGCIQSPVFSQSYLLWWILVTLEMHEHLSWALTFDTSVLFKKYCTLFKCLHIIFILLGTKTKLTFLLNETSIQVISFVFYFFFNTVSDTLYNHQLWFQMKCHSYTTIYTKLQRYYPLGK